MSAILKVLRFASAGARTRSDHSAKPLLLIPSTISQSQGVRETSQAPAVFLAGVQRGAAPLHFGAFIAPSFLNVYLRFDRCCVESGRGVLLQTLVCN